MTRILIVDDSSFMRGSLKYIIERAGHEVTGMASDGSEALEMYKKLKPDVVTMDILMKGTDGMTALRNIMEHDPNARVLIITALGTEQMKNEARRLRAKGYIRKPFSKAEIISEINRVMAEERP